MPPPSATPDPHAAANPTAEVERLRRELEAARLQERAAEVRAASYARAHEALLRAWEGFAAVDKFEDAICVFLREVIEVAGASMAALAHARSDAEGSSSLLVFLDGEQAVIGHEAAAFDDVPLDPTQLADVRDGRPVVWSRERWRTARAGAGGVERVGGTAWHVPLALRRKVTAVLALGFREADAPNPLLSPLVAALTNQLAVALEMKRLSDGSRAAAVTRERELAAERRADELARANAILQSAAEKVTAAETPSELREHFLLAAATAAGATGGALFTRLSGTSFSPRAVVFAGRVVPPEIWAGDTVFTGFEERTGADPTGFFALLARGEGARLVVDEAEPYWWRDSIVHHRARGTKVVWHVPLILAGDTVGFLGLTFADTEAPHEDVVGSVRALARQATLVLKLAEQADAARAAAIGRERARAAEQRVEVIARLARASRETLDRLAAKPDVSAFLGHVLDACAHTLGAVGASVWETQADGSTRVTLSFDDGVLQSGTQSHHPGARGQPFFAGFESAVDRQGGLVTYDEHAIATEPELAPYRDYLAARGVRTLIVVPMMFAGTARGAITVRFAEPRALTAEEIELAKAFANQGVLALELTRLTRSAQAAAVVEERNRLAREIHDTLAQALAAIIRQLESATGALRGGPAAARQPIAMATKVARDALVEARRSIKALRPSALEGRTLEGALRGMTDNLRARSPVPLLFSVTGSPFPVAPDVEDELVRIAHEAITNALNHARARRITVELAFEAASVRLVVRDDGVGFEPPGSSSGGIGMQSMRERAERVGATLTLVSEPASGTEVFVVWSPPAGDGRP